MRRGGVLIALLCLAGGAPAAGTAPLGRLFFTPEQRDALDARRRARLPDKPVSAVPAPARRIDGYVLRSDGRSTVWVDGQASPGGSESGGLRVSPRPENPGRVSLTAARGERRADVPVGATLEGGDSGANRDVIGDGEVRVRRHGAR